MKTCLLGSSDIKITSVIMGTWQAGKEMWSGIDDNETIRAIRSAFEAGITTIDTAETYGNGHSEKIVGQAIKKFRKQVVIATKVFVNHLKYDQLIQACHNSLKNLGTDYIDLYQIHWPSGSMGNKVVPVDETLRAMDDLKQQGKIRAIGVSNFSKIQLEKASACTRIDSLQPPYSLFWRHLEKDALPFCMENNITILAYSPMAQGILTGKFGFNHKFSKSDHRKANRLFQPENYQRVQSALTKLGPIAKRNKLTIGQLALAWVCSHQNTCAIAGARNREQVQQNAKAGSVQLSIQDIAEMEDIGRTVTDFLDDNPVLWRR